VWLSFHIDKNHLKEIVLPKSFFLDTFQPHIKQQPSQINALMKVINNPEPNNDTTSEHLINQWSNQRETQNFLLFKVFSESLAYEGDDGVQLAILKALRNIVVQLVIAIDIENAENREQTNDSRSDSAILLELKSLDSTIKENLEEEGNYEDLEKLEFNPEKQIKEDVYPKPFGQKYFLQLLTQFDKEYTLLGNQRILGLWVVPASQKLGQMLERWDGIFYINRGKYKGGRFKFIINFPERFPDEGPQFHFISYIHHQLVKNDETAFNPPQFSWTNSCHVYMLINAVRDIFFDEQEYQDDDNTKISECVEQSKSEFETTPSHLPDFSLRFNPIGETDEKKTKQYCRQFTSMSSDQQVHFQWEDLFKNFAPKNN
ncbi:MAG: hypothetical protein EZS28_011935, partial [Streblomastix strix]